jgi:hypothetical protein
MMAPSPRRCRLPQGTVGFFKALSPSPSRRYLLHDDRVFPGASSSSPGRWRRYRFCRPFGTGDGGGHVFPGLKPRAGQFRPCRAHTGTEERTICDRAGRFKGELEYVGRGGGSLASTRETTMKKKTKKLVLAKETLHTLELITVTGGVSSIDVACGSGDCNESAFPNRCPRMPASARC